MRRGTRARGTVALSAVIALLGAGIAQADEINNSINNTLPLDGTRKVQPYTAGSAAVSVGFRVENDNLSSSTTTGTGCDAQDGTPLFLQLSPPAGVTVSSTSFISDASKPRTLQFVKCSNGTNETQSVSFSSAATLAASDYLINASWTDSAGAYTNNAPFTLRVQAPAQSAASTTLAVANASAAYDAASVTLSATLSSGTSKVSGKSVAFKVAGVTVGSGTTNEQGVATYDYALDKTRPVGSYDLQATWAGDATHASSNSTVGSLAVTKAAQSISFTAPAAKTFGGESFTVSPTATSGLTVSVASSTPSVCTVNSGLVALTGAGTCTLTATQPGDDNWSAATAVPRSFDVAKANQSITVTFTPETATFGDGPVTYSATASSGLDVASSITSGPCTLDGSALTLTGAGPCVVTATQAGNDNYNGAQNVVRTFDIAKANQTINFTAPTGKTFGDAAFALGATATSGAAVSYAVLDGPCTVANGQLTANGAGDCVVTASQAGNDNYNAASDVTRTVVIAKANQTITFTAPTGKKFGDAPFALGGSADSELAVSYTVNSGPCTEAAGTLTITGAGDCVVTASQAGNANYNAATVVQRTITIAKADQTITFTAPTGKTFGDAPFALGASADSGLAVAYASTGPCTVAANGTLTITGAGDCTVTASQAGNANYNPANGEQRTFTIAKADQAISFTSPSGKTYGDAPFALGASSTSGLAVSYANTGPCTVANGTLTITGAGDCPVTASQAGNGNYNAAPNVTRTFTVAPKTLTGSFTAADKLYDGTAAASITSSSLSGVVAGDAVTLNGSAATAAFADPAVGNGKTVTSSGFTLAGTGAANYSLTMNTTTANILPWTFKGFYQPVDMNNVVNTVKAGATVPFKFEVFKGATELTDTASIKSLTAKTVNCASTATVDDIELTATGGTSLRYDATAGQYIYNWQTPKTIGTCYAVTISAQDGSGATAYFKTK